MKWGIFLIIGIGTDIIEIFRIEDRLSKNPALVEQIFTRAEAEYCQRKALPYASYAAAFAGKEAVLKTMGCGIGRFSLKEIEIIHTQGGKPEVILQGKALEHSLGLGIKKLEISLSHSRENALAFAVAIGEES